MNEAAKFLLINHDGSIKIMDARSHDMPHLHLAEYAHGLAVRLNWAEASGADVADESIVEAPRQIREKVYRRLRTDSIQGLHGYAVYEQI